MTMADKDTKEKQEKQGKKAAARESYINAQKLQPDLKDLAEALKRVS